mmetsp:Transcript_11799/g.47606  ORF Transcript_11799/g.47606 Transcript_11799/m.47606 type:complete len:204 (+) Transcript_11799:56-667(+)
MRVSRHILLSLTADERGALRGKKGRITTGLEEVSQRPSSKSGANSQVSGTPYGAVIQPYGGVEPPGDAAAGAWSSPSAAVGRPCSGGSSGSSAADRRASEESGTSSRSPTSPSDVAVLGRSASLSENLAGGTRGVRGLLRAPSTSMRIAHRGHVALRRSHGTMHSWWYRCGHSRFATTSPSLNAVRQMVHTGADDATSSSSGI